MSARQNLPAGFEALVPFVARWAAATTAERARRRSDSTAEERQTFFDAAAPRLQAAMAYLDAKPLPELDDADKRLLNLMMGFSHVQMAVEVHRETEPRHAAWREAMVITHSATDLA
ncbi:MAG: hypothetical protein WCY29_07900 [Novosphingobium sp.]